MSDGVIHLEPEPVGRAHAHEIVRDEDVLSPDIQRDLESLGTAIAFVAAAALVFGHIKRAGRTIRLMRDLRAGAAETGRG
jgi:hypothetical protein